VSGNAKRGRKSSFSDRALGGKQKIKTAGCTVEGTSREGGGSEFSLRRPTSVGTGNKARFRTGEGHAYGAQSTGTTSTSS